MTPKEKAKELIEKFINLNSVKISDYSKIEYPTAKQCALIAVEEMLKYSDFHCEFLQQVKQEIEKL